MPGTVMVVGVARYLGARIASSLSRDPKVERVVGVDVVPPARDVGPPGEDLSAVEFVEADITTSAIHEVITQVGPDVVVHMNILATRSDAGGRAPQKEINVIGTMQLLAACQRSETVRKLVVKSSTAVYGAGPGSPALFSEDMAQGAMTRRGYEKDASEVEAYIRGFSRRRPDVAVTILRLANVLGPIIRTSLSDYFTLPAVPVVFGRDPRFQLVHEDDAVDAIHLATGEDRPGIFNVAGDEFLGLSQALLRAGRMPVALPSLGSPFVRGIMRRAGVADLDAVQVRFLTYGRGVDTTRMRDELRFTPRFSTVETFDSFAAAQCGRALLDRGRLATAERAARCMVRTFRGDGG
ncbi:NAD-dependent epimerase/dehydratase family protein [Actinobacteria bacterium YIM 96077]|uniref:Epimerase n=1 Tax=Phytoactinopolyspora halophila TaxID=1981511 RepID=A0A329QKW7_9ACTN|nr:NAD-dependent epimerase/dehydratase family protein [Phytoactinopolyspora halophila]AYY14813.1 NAD-dependent epimerase/dehydratase family protein [Actinobacteria bacterium YIM 96077]RAW13087.1 epimerase [Phytoactinopolyspora halophila]